MVFTCGAQWGSHSLAVVPAHAWMGPRDHTQLHHGGRTQSGWSLDAHPEHVGAAGSHSRPHTCRAADRGQGAASAPEGRFLQRFSTCRRVPEGLGKGQSWLHRWLWALPSVLGCPTREQSRCLGGQGGHSGVPLGSLFQLCGYGVSDDVYHLDPFWGGGPGQPQGDP